MRARLLAPLAALLALLLTVTVALAQDGPDYDAWTKVADNAERVTEQGRASDEALETLRAQLVDWREQFLSAQGLNSDRIATLRNQIAALGPAPDAAAGTTESEDVAARRAELTDQLNRLRAPVIAGEEAYLRADGLIREIDTLIRDRRTERLLELGPTPLDPRNWGEAGKALLSTARAIYDESIASWQSPTGRVKLYSNLPVTLLFLFLGALLIGRSRVWIRRLASRIRKLTRKGSGVWRVMVSFGQIVLPLIGIMLLLRALELTGVFGPRAAPLIDSLPAWGASLLLVWWVGDEVFSRNDELATIPINATLRAEARVHIAILALCQVAHSFVWTLVSSENYSEEVRVVLELPVIAVAGVSLLRLGLILSARRVASPDAEGETTQSYAMRLMWFIGRAAMVIGVVGPVMQAVGYGSAGVALVYPAIGTLILLGVITILQRLVFDLYYLVTGERDQEQGGLIPVLAGFVLVLLALPVLALIWGARTADLTEIWARFREGYSFGETRISPGDFLTFVLVFMIGYMATRILQGGLRNSVLPKTRIDPGGQTALLSGIGYVGIFISALIAITSAGIDLTALGYVAGALSVGIGFGLQNIVSNFVSGIILLIERPISKGDWIAVGGQMGYVRDISVRSTRIETFDRTDVIVPNSDFISGTVTNYTRGNTIGRVIAPVGVAYGTDTRKVEKILREIAEAHPMVLANPPPNVVFRGFGADSLDFEIRVILRDVNWSMSVHSDLNHEIARRFAEEGIEIPFAQRDIWLRNPEALRQAVAGQGEPVAPSAPVLDEPPENPTDEPEQNDAPSAEGSEGEGRI
ncbi:DUF3772 domain-containing protein [Seohaeicola zhoushanensis]|uniref:Mechanosensitive ion channel protein MscS n=1 Tax=Seohaeicola zhoushanensis TaxID=1569283 RepID=A0A8J3H0J1_9RHOB|nr:DUF3772 domain-containing protein [Seohaeicola zhoushanensis]GHF68043.1 mechanosensitive ion channel protein MscS [Seohaeicola zhoushanensis]